MDMAAEALDMDPFELRRINMMRIGSRTHTQQELTTASLDRVLDAAEEASRWEKGAPRVRGSQRQDLDGPDTRKPCTLGARIGTQTDTQTKDERVAS
jgi:CO/xanthine dehydrogenase Mo-binding subunit